MKLKITTLLILSLSLFLFVIDRIFKYIFSTYGREYFILGDWFKLKLAYNSGIAFGLPINYYLLLFLYIVVFLILIYFFIKSYREKNIFYIFSFSLIISGAISNFLDRIYVGQVIDYLDLRFYSVFNLADVMIVAGALLLLVENFKKEKKKKISD